MAHYARVNNGIVEQVIVAEQDFIDYISSKSVGEWIQTSYNTRGGIHYQPNSNTPSDDQSKALRKNYAGFGFTYNKTLDAFIPPKPFESWILNETTCLWEPPIPYPTTGEYLWNEENQTWEISNND